MSNHPDSSAPVPSRPQGNAGLPILKADLLLVHPPAFFDFRNCRQVYFPFLGTSGDVPITPLYEYFPIGFKTLQQYLSEGGHDVRLLNLSTLLLRYPQISLRTVFDALDVRLVGIDLHWMVHVQGSLAIAERLKRWRPDLSIIFGGISSTYYAEELIQFPYIDMVMRGYETHEPLMILLRALKSGADLSIVPNLVWRSPDGTIRDNGYLHKPDRLASGVDWSGLERRAEADNSFPIYEIISTLNEGCSFDCGWCGGSRSAFRRIHQRNGTVIHKSADAIANEWDSLGRSSRANRYHIYSVGCYNEPDRSVTQLLNHVARANCRSISYEQYYLTPDRMLKQMAAANPRTSITLSPESHDRRISRLAGRGVYSNEELESWLDRALEYGIHQVDIWYFIGMPEQDERSVRETVEYCQYLLEKFRDRRVNPMICPMIPFLDPASNFFENPEQHGYRVFYRTIEDHRRGMQRPSPIKRINYETRWLSRAEIVHTGYHAVRDLMLAKAAVGMLPRSAVTDYTARIDHALEFIEVVDAADSIPDPRERAVELEVLGDEILRQNDMIFFSGVSNQAFPINRKIGGRWFDELGWEVDELDAAFALT